jgi:hypothetical protein
MSSSNDASGFFVFENTPSAGSPEKLSRYGGDFSSCEIACDTPSFLLTIHSNGSRIVPQWICEFPVKVMRPICCTKISMRFADVSQKDAKLVILECGQWNGGSF